MNPFYQARGKFVAQADEIRPQYLDPDNVSGSAIFQANITRDVGPTLGASISAIDQEQLNQVGGLAELAVPWYSDQILPFDITLAASNEYGAMAGAKILGVEILNEGTGVSIDDTVTETQATFVARAVETAQTRSLFSFPLSATFPIRSRSPSPARRPTPWPISLLPAAATWLAGCRPSVMPVGTDGCYLFRRSCATAQDTEGDGALLDASGKGEKRDVPRYGIKRLGGVGQGKISSA